METLGYNSYGYLSTISAGGSVRYTITGRNAREQLTAATYGSNLTATYGYDAYGYPGSTKTGTVQDYGYVFNPVTGNLASRENKLRGKSESFAYDTDGKDLDRLTSVTGPQNLTMTYADNGNISTKSDIDATAGFSYGLNAGPYALTGVTTSTNIIPAVSQTVTYNSFEKVSSINEANGSQTINTSFTYNCDNQRASMTVGVYYGPEIMTRYYVGGSYMKEVQPGTTNEYTYLGGDAYTAPVVVHNARGVVSYYYLLRDYLGNITHQVNTSNAVVAEFSFDAWGRRRNATNWTYTLDANDKALFADRGFTGHEYLPWYKLYNMNGRMYDPAVGRFLNVDPYVQMPDNTQNFNRYSYCLNNPLKYNDPDGEIIFTILAAIFAPPLLPLAIAADISGGLNVASHWSSIKNSDNVWQGIGKGLGFYGVGSAQFAASYYGGPLGALGSSHLAGMTNSLLQDGTLNQYGFSETNQQFFVNLAVSQIGLGDAVGKTVTKGIGQEMTKNISKRLIQQNVDKVFSQVAYRTWEKGSLIEGLNQGWKDYIERGGWYQASLSAVGQGIMDSKDIRTIARNENKAATREYFKEQGNLKGFDTPFSTNWLDNFYNWQSQLLLYPGMELKYSFTNNPISNYPLYYRY